MNKLKVLKASATVASAGENITFNVPAWAKGAVFFVDLSAVAGNTPLFDVKLQYKDHIGNWRDTGFALGQQTAAARGMFLAVGPSLVDKAGATTGRHYNGYLTPEMRLVTTLDRTTGDETYTYSIAVVWQG
jgi:hypothetical protein